MAEFIQHKMDGKQISLLARKYFEEVLNVTLSFEVVKVNFDEKKGMWLLEAEVGPFYSKARRYKLEIGANGDIINVEQVSNSPYGLLKE